MYYFKYICENLPQPHLHYLVLYMPIVYIMFVIYIVCVCVCVRMCVVLVNPTL